MPINDPAAPSQWRKPRALVQVDSGPVFAPSAIEVTSNNYYAADQFHAIFPIASLPAAYGAQWWSERSAVRVDVQFGTVPAGGREDDAVYQTFLRGRVDQVSLDLVAGLLTIDGRDGTADLIETKTQETFANQTSSEVAETLAARHELTAAVTRTTTLVGQYYQLEHDGTTLDELAKSTTEWDLLVYLAKHEGFDVFVDGATLHFQPRTEPDADPYLVQWAWSPWTLNGTALQMRRALTLAGDIEVSVKTWQAKTKEAVVRTVRATGTKSTSSDLQRFVFIKPNMSQTEALKFAQSQLQEISKHERVINLEMPGDLLLTPRNIIELRGTETDFDQRYYVDEIIRSMSFDGEFRMTVRAKNHSPNSEAVVR